MKKKIQGKLTLNVETLCRLEQSQVKRVAGGNWTCVVSCRADCGTETLSIELCDPSPSN